MDGLQENIDRFYWANGKCCAGCDWWCAHNSSTGDCTKSAPVSGKERFDMFGIQSSSLPLPAGHIVTKRGHVCGNFKDDFDWQSLSPFYRRMIGMPKRRPHD